MNNTDLKFKHESVSSFGENPELFQKKIEEVQEMLLEELHEQSSYTGQQRGRLTMDNFNVGEKAKIQYESIW